MKTLITDIIEAINTGSTALEANALFIQYCTDFNIIALAPLIERKIEVIKRYFHNKMEADTVYASLSFQADQVSRDGVITPRAVKALQALYEGNTTWSGVIVSNTKDADGLDTPKQFTATEMLEFADLVTADVEGYFLNQKNHCNAVELLATEQEVLDYDFT